ncbi:hypothetical protein QZH41_010154 [Actinostola sp. cb2023]|nr:hypothetical protein QZH41_010154 [Actinostola sp. cb2023]
MEESRLLSSLHNENIVPNLSLLAETLKSSLPASVKPKRAQWYSPCSSPRPKQPQSPDDNLPILKLNHFEKTPRVLFGGVKLGSSKIEELVVWNPHPVAQTLRVEKSPSKRGFTIVCSDDGESSLLSLDPDEEVVLPIKWEPIEAGKCRELIMFKWNETHRLHAIVMGTAVDTKTKKKRRSVLCNSQAFNTKQAKKPFKPHFSVVTKDTIHTQEKLHKPVINFGKTIPDVKEIPEDETCDERRETYVVTTVLPQNTRVPNSKSKLDKDILTTPTDVATKGNVASKGKSVLFDVKVDTKKEEYSERRETYVQDTVSVITTKCAEKELQPQDTECKENMKEQLPFAKAPASKPISRANKPNVKESVQTAVVKKQKVNPPPMAFDVQPTKKCERPKTLMQKKAQRDDKLSSLKKTRKVKLKVAAKGVAPTKLKLIKPVKTSIPRHPMPFAAKNMYYDERWIEKQEQGFARWLNFMLTPPDDCELMWQSQANANKDPGSMTVTATKSTTSSQPKAPSREELSLKAYTARRKMARLRRGACLLYQSEPVVCIIRKIEAEVEQGRLSIRPDKKMHADLGIKRNIVNMILSYNPLWLRIGLEITFGEILPVQSNSDVNGLTRFLTDRMLGNPDLAHAYAHPKVPGLFKDGYLEQLARYTLKKFLFLVLFLDRAKLTRIIDHDPCLFTKEADFKSSRSLLLTFSREYLRGEGDITKHLSYLGFAVTHQQRPIDEVDYAVTNVATDLRDGLRLTRVIELLTHNWQLTQNLRIPAISRLQKIHNVEVFMEAIKQDKIPIEGSGINPRDIVDGHREKTLQLLWLIIFNFQVNVVLSENQLLQEISFLEQNHDLQDRLNTIDGSTILGLPRSKRESLESDIYFKSRRLSLLLKWCKLVCKTYGLKVENFTVSFSDGRALCYLLHFYHPSLLPLSLIKQDTTLTRNPGIQEDSEEEEEGIVRDSWAGSYSPGSGTNTEIERLKANERENFKVLAEKVRDLGGVPMMTKFSDMSNTIPDEKVVITYTSYLCARLLDLRDETRAARTIQVAWRRFQLKKHLHRRQALIKAVVLAQAYARGALIRRRFVKLVKSTVIIQTAYREYRARQELKHRTEAACRIQGTFRANRNMLRVRAAFLRYKKAVTSIQALTSTISIQAAFRRRVAETKYKNLKASTITIQRYLRSYCMMKRAQTEFKTMKSAAIAIQSIYRQHQCRTAFLEKRRAVIKVQAYVRRYVARMRYLALKDAAIVIQRRYRALCQGRQQRLSYHIQRGALITIQAAVRGFLVRRGVRRQGRAATTIQTSYRRFSTMKKFQSLKSSTMLIQRRYRAYMTGRVERLKYEATKQAIIAIQAAYRGYMLKKATLILQTRYRAAKQGQTEAAHYQKIRSAAVVIQAYYQGSKVRTEVRQKRKAATVIQANYRRHVEQSKYRSLKQATAVINRRYRAMQEGRVQRQRYQLLRSSAIIVQAAFRGHQARKLYKKLKAVVCLQSAVRGFIVRRRVKLMNNAAIQIQSVYRGYSAFKRYVTVKRAVATIQTRLRAVILGRREAQRLRYLALNDAAIVLQRRYRALRQGRQQRLSYHIQRGALITIQAAVRGFLVRRGVRRQGRAATTIQTSYRRFSTMKKFQSLKSSTMLIQRRYRAYMTGRVERLKYEATKQAIIAIQAAYRGYRLKKATLILQTRYRAAKQGHTEAAHYRKIRSAAVVIQAYYQGTKVRTEVRQKHKAATVIQANYRRHVEQSKYRSLKQATAVINRRYRAMQEGRVQRQRYQLLRSSAITVQSAFRGHQARKLYKKLRAVVCLQSVVRGCIVRRQVKLMNNAAIQIQSVYRGYIAFKRYVTVKRAIDTIQTRFRAFILGRREAQRYQQMKHAAIKLQSIYRQHQCRTAFLETRRAVIKVQACVRRYVARMRYLALKDAAIVIQRRYRALRQGQQQRLSYHIQRGALITIQAAVRGFLVRRGVRRQGRAATTIQTSYRRFSTTKKFQSLKSSTMLIQRRYRAYVIGRVERWKYEATKQAIIAIQAAYRGYRVRKEIQHWHSSAVCIQAMYRCFVLNTRYDKLKKATLILQTRYRAAKQGQTEAAHYRKIRSAAVVIQAYYQGTKVRTEVRQKHKAATVIQANYRRHVEQSKYRSLKQATAVINRRYRAMQEGRVQRQRYQLLRSSAITVQAAFRGHQARKLYKKLRAVVCLQSAVRGFIVRRQVKVMNNAAIQIQSVYRGYSAFKRYVTVKRAVATIQTRFRAFILGRREAQRYEQMKHAAIKLQAAYRGHRSRHEVKLIRAAITLQARYRGYIARKEFYSIRNAVICIQASVRCFLAARYYKRLRRAVIFMQQRHRANVLLLKEYMWYHVQRGACIVLQAAVRRYISRKAFNELNTATIVIQRRYRALVQGRQQRDRYRAVKAAAITIQCFTRGMQARKLLRLNFAARTLQAHYRMYLTRKAYTHLRSNVVRVQALVRMVQQRRRYAALKEASLTIQIRYRAFLLGSAVQKNYQRFKAAAIVVQKVYRGHAARKEYQRLRAAIKIQVNFKAYFTRKKFLRYKRSVVVIQSIVKKRYVRGFMARKHVRQILAARTIQRHYRAVRLATSVRHEYLTIRASIVVIQAGYRGYCGRKQALMHRAARTIQTAVRGFLARKELQKLQEERRQRLTRFSAAALYHLSAIKIQRSYRQARALAVARKQMTSVLYIQCWWRAVSLRRHFIDMRSAATVIQNAMRRKLDLKHRAATRIQATARVWLARRTVAKMNEAALRIQALFRGYQVRCRVKSLKVKAARRRIKAANKAATESMKLCNRTRSALDYLLRCKNLTTIFDVLVNLEVVTRLSYVCCQQLVKDKALQIIFTVIRNSNRSLPHMEILKYSLAILINLAKDMINSTKLVDKVKSAHFLVARKYKLQKRRSVVKAKMSQGTPYKNAPPSTPFKQTPFKSHTPFKARKTSEWAMWQDYVNKDQDPLQAVRSLLRTLRVDFE